MTCPRCSARMIVEAPFRYTDLTGSEASYSDLWKCLMCGNYEDKVVRRNRLKQAEEVK